MPRSEAPRPTVVPARRATAARASHVHEPRVRRRVDEARSAPSRRRRRGLPEHQPIVGGSRCRFHARDQLRVALHAARAEPWRPNVAADAAASVAQPPSSPRRCRSSDAAGGRAQPRRSYSEALAGPVRRELRRAARSGLELHSAASTSHASFRYADSLPFASVIASVPVASPKPRSSPTTLADLRSSRHVRPQVAMPAASRRIVRRSGRAARAARISSISSIDAHADHLHSRSRNIARSSSSVELGVCGRSCHPNPVPTAAIAAVRPHESRERIPTRGARAAESGSFCCGRSRAPPRAAASPGASGRRRSRGLELARAAAVVRRHAAGATASSARTRRAPRRPPSSRLQASPSTPFSRPSCRR